MRHVSLGSMPVDPERVFPSSACCELDRANAEPLPSEPSAASGRFPGVPGKRVERSLGRSRIFRAPSPRPPDRVAKPRQDRERRVGLYENR
jgi:hypothetical protein